MKCKICGKRIWDWQEREYTFTIKNHYCDEWHTTTSKYEYAHQKCIIQCKKN